MRKSLIICIWVHICLGLVQVCSIFCGCQLRRNYLLNGQIHFQSAKDVNATEYPDYYWLEFSCRTGYDRIGPRYILCFQEQWTDVVPKCRIKRCRYPEKIENGYIPAVVDQSFGSSFEYRCNAGFKPANDFMPTLNCALGDGSTIATWIGKKPVCKALFCDRPEPLANGIILEMQSTNLTSFPYNYMLNYECDENFRIAGGFSRRSCDRNGWSGPTPYCEVIQCPDPGVPEHGSREGSSFEIGAKVHFNCFSGYYLIGSFERFCMPNGRWTGELTRCDTDSNYCPDPGVPINGFKSSSNYDMGDKVGFQCRPGYTQAGDEMRECMPDGTWSGKETTCLGRYDFLKNLKIRDHPNVTIVEYNQQMEIEEFHRNEFLQFHNGMGPIDRVVNLSRSLKYPERLILYFIFDEFHGAGREGFDKSIRFAKAIVKRVGISKNGHGAAAISSNYYADFLPMDFITTEEVMDALDKIDYADRGRHLVKLLTLVREEFIPLVQAVVARRGLKSIIFIFTDGMADISEETVITAKLLKRSFVEIYCIGVDVKLDTLSKLASYKKEEHVFILQDYLTLSWMPEKITDGAMDYSECGLGLETVGSQVHRNRSGGNNQTVEPWPWMAAIYFLKPASKEQEEAQVHCGGSIINWRFILTAAHCLFTAESMLRSPEEIIIKLGLAHVENETNVNETVVQRLYIHPKYQTGLFYDYDIALLQLRTPIKYNTYVRPICLPPLDLPPNSTLYNSNEYSVAADWDHKSVFFMDKDVMINTVEDFKEIILPIQSIDRCKQSLENQSCFNATDFTERIFCAGNEQESQDTSHGVSGGPLMQAQLNEEGHLFWTQIGTVSQGIGCGQPNNTYGFYSNVHLLRSWVDATIAEAEKIEL